MAEELLELGRAAARQGAPRRPFLEGRPDRRFALGQFAEIGGFVTDGFSFAFGTLADIVNIPTGILSQGVDVVFTNVADLLGQIPILGELAAQVLLLANVVIKFALSVPGMALEGVSNVFSGISKAIAEKYSKPEQEEKKQQAGDKILERAMKAGGPEFQKSVSDVIGVKASPNSPAASGALPEAIAEPEGLIPGVPDWALAAGAGALLLTVVVAA